jgi:hypothetical protein
VDNYQSITQREIRPLIKTIRGIQVIVDSDLAELYHVETKVLNKAVKRNLERFPDSFWFQLTELEDADLRFQFGTSRKTHGGRRYLPYVFTEQGVAMLSGVLRSEIAIKVSIEIINTFVEMRKMLFSNAALFSRIGMIELKQVEQDDKFEKVFKALEGGKLQNERGVFFDGQIFDAYSFVSDIIRSSLKSIILIDNYVDDTLINNQLNLDLQKYNSQYPEIRIELLKNAHDRFLIIDETELYHVGASLKDLGKKWFAFSKMNSELGKLLGLLNLQSETK